MTIGTREEPFEIKLKRHISETKEMISGWEGELEFAVKKGNNEYKTHCENLIKIWENTLEKLEKELSN